jgi:ribosomal protein S18 acetylase RimI-like enzyme
MAPEASDSGWCEFSDRHASSTPSPSAIRLVSCWSNELGGEVCVLDELYVEPAQRGQGYATRLIDDLAAGALPWATNAVALALEVTPDNDHARRWYERLDFSARNLAMCRRLHR